MRQVEDENVRLTCPVQSRRVVSPEPPVSGERYPRARALPHQLVGESDWPHFATRTARRRPASSATVGLLGECCRFCASTPPHQVHFVADGDLAAFDDEAVQSKLAFEAPVDTAGDFLVLNEGVGVV